MMTMEPSPETHETMVPETTQFDDENPIPTTEWLRRVWVCGPPMMNEQFDRAFDDFLEPDLIDPKATATETPGILHKWQIDLM